MVVVVVVVVVVEIENEEAETLDIDLGLICYDFIVNISLYIQCGKEKYCIGTLFW